MQPAICWIYYGRTLHIRRAAAEELEEPGGELAIVGSRRGGRARAAGWGQGGSRWLAGRGAAAMSGCRIGLATEQQLCGSTRRETAQQQQEQQQQKERQRRVFSPQPPARECARTHALLPACLTTSAFPSSCTASCCSCTASWCAAPTATSTRWAGVAGAAGASVGAAGAGLCSWLRLRTAQQVQRSSRGKGGRTRGSCTHWAFQQFRLPCSACRS